MKKFILSFIILILILAVSACGEKSYDANEFFPEESSSLGFAWYDGKQVRGEIFYSFENEKAIKDILGVLRSMESEKLDIATPENLLTDIYGLQFMSESGSMVSALCAENYLITENSVYKFNENIDSLAKKYLSEAESTDWNIYFPGLSHIAKKDGKWVKNILPKASLHLEAEPAENVQMAVQNYTGESITVLISNNSESSFSLGSQFYLQAEIDGEWYDIPYAEDVSWHDVLYEIESGSEIEEKKQLFMYGELPSGKYRIVIESLTAEFSVE